MIQNKGSIWENKDTSVRILEREREGFGDYQSLKDYHLWITLLLFPTLAM